MHATLSVPNNANAPSEGANARLPAGKWDWWRLRIMGNFLFAGGA